MNADSVAITLGIISTIISVITLIVLVKGRNNGLRENLYNRQLDIFQSLYSKIIDLEEFFHEWLPIVVKYNDDNLSEKEFNKAESELEEIELKIEYLMDELDEEFAKAQILVPDEIAVVIGKFLETFEKIEKMYYDDTLTNKELRQFGEDVFEFEDSIRKFIGLEKLSKENRRLF